MARNRMIKPEFWDDEKLAIKISKSARLLYIGMWNFSDDYAVIKGHSKWLKNKIFGYENDTIEQFELWLKELENLKRILPFQNSNEKYYYLPKFPDHQTINRPSKQRNPEPPSNILEDSRPTHDPLIDEGKGRIKEIKLKEGKDQNPSFLEINSDHQKQLNELTKKLLPIFPDIIHFRNEILNLGKNPKTLIHAFERALKKQKFDDTRGGIQAYCYKIVMVEDGNYNYNEFRENHEKLKKITLGIGEKIQ